MAAAPGAGLGFIHLHVHSPFSFLDGASPVERLLERAKALGMPALGLTDHNTLAGAIRFYTRAKETGIRPILGAEVDVEGGYHLTLLAEDLEGYHSLCRLLTQMHLANRGLPARATREMLAEHSRGLIALSGCSRGKVPSLLAQGEREGAARAAAFYREVYPGRFYMELIHHPDGHGGRPLYRLAELARDLGLPVVATNDVHHATMEEYAVNELLTAIRLILPVEQMPGPRTVERYLKSPQEMGEIFRDFPQAMKNSVEIAGRCQLELPLGEPKLPCFPLAEGETAPSRLRQLAFEGALWRYGRLTPGVVSRLEHELAVIHRLAFETYFLVVWDIARFARGRGIRYLCRGSGANSLVAYSLGISQVDPLEHHLLFERFLHEKRTELPDIDLDLPRSRRDEVRDYVLERYGRDNVAAVATISTFQARGAIREAGKALGMPQEVVEELLAGVRWGTVKEVMESREALPELRSNRALKDPRLQGFLRLCSALDGLPRHLSVHLGGLVIGPGELRQWAPLQWSSGGDIIAQYDKDDIERLGLIKLDLLQVPTMDVIEDTVSLVKEARGMDVDIDAIPRDDPQVFAMHQEGDTIGCFQVESPAQREMAGRLLPQSFEDIILLLALIRPGPMRSRMHEKYLKVRLGREPVRYLDPRLELVLRETLGQLVYQEQVLQIAHELAGMSYADADGLRRAMTHERSAQEMEKLREAFVSSCLRNGVAGHIAEKAWEEVSAFAAYGFPKGHAAAYAIPAYQTLWLKRYYLPEFLCALFNHQPMGYYPPRVLVQYARWQGVEVLPPDINRSRDRYTVEGGAIRVGLSQLKGMPEAALQSILEAREAGGPFTGMGDFLARTRVPRPVVEGLVRVGALDSLGQARQQMLLASGHRPRTSSQGTLNLPFNTMDRGVNIPHAPPEASRVARLRQEMELLGLPLSGHPQALMDGRLKGIARIGDLKGFPDGHPVRLAVWVIRYQTPPTRDGKRVVYICAEDGTGIVDITLFSDGQQRSGEALFKTSWLVVEGTIQRRGPKALSVVAERVEALKSPARR